MGLICISMMILEYNIKAWCVYSSDSLNRWQFAQNYFFYKHITDEEKVHPS